MSHNTPIKATTVLAVAYNNQLAIGADGQATLGNTVAKSHVKKIHKLLDGKVVIGFAGATADAFTLRDLFAEKLSNYPANMKRAAIEVAKEWRTKSYLRLSPNSIVWFGSFLAELGNWREQGTFY